MQLSLCLCPFFLGVCDCCPCEVWKWTAWEQCRMVKGGGMTLRLLWATKSPKCWISGCALLFQEEKNLKSVFLSRLQGNMEVSAFKGWRSFLLQCDIFFSDPMVVYFSGPFRVIIIQIPFCYFQKPAFLASVLIIPTFTNVNELLSNFFFF